MISKSFFIVSEENLLKNVKQMDKALKQLEIDLKNAQTNKMAPANDKFVPVMEISFWKNNMYCQNVLHNIIYSYIFLIKFT